MLQTDGVVLKAATKAAFFVNHWLSLLIQVKLILIRS